MLADAPVSYPFLWDTPQHDVVQWLGIAKSGGPFDIQSLARNVGEVLGVFAEITIPEKPSILNLGYSSSVKIPELGELGKPVENAVVAAVAGRFSQDRPDCRREGSCAVPDQLPFVPCLDQPQRIPTERSRR